MLRLDCPVELDNRGPYSTFHYQPQGRAGRLSLDIPVSPDVSVAWPNREGELFCTTDVQRFFRRRMQSVEGLSIAYPSTASCRTLVIHVRQEGGVVLTAPPAGRVTRFTVRRGEENRIHLDIDTGMGSWLFRSYQGELSLFQHPLKAMQRHAQWRLLEKSSPAARYLVQVGLIGPNGGTKVPRRTGFAVLGTIARRMSAIIGEGSILHVFGYSRGHDRGYPDYRCSRRLGGESGMREALREVHRQGQKAVFYLNGRIAEQSMVENDQALEQARFLAADGNPIVEHYHGRRFYVMNPGSEIWRERLWQTALYLKECGADGVQLDQLGGIITPAEPGDPWGEGYVRLIDRIRKAGLLVWIQGLSDLYPADWFEMTYRKLNILDDGTVRGGCPLGTVFADLYVATVPHQTLLVPLSKIDHLPQTGNYRCILDAEDEAGKLFLYDRRYLDTLTGILEGMKREAERVGALGPGLMTANSET